MGCGPAEAVPLLQGPLRIGFFDRVRGRALSKPFAAAQRGRGVGAASPRRRISTSCGRFLRGLKFHPSDEDLSPGTPMDPRLPA